VVRALPERFGVVALAAGQNLDEVVEQIAVHGPELVSVANADGAAELAARLAGRHKKLPEIQHGPRGLVSVATHPSADIVVSAAVGIVGLEATHEAVKRGKRVALANKEILVAAGELVVAAARASGCELLPIDSEHVAIHQCLRGSAGGEIRRLILTASGGPFLDSLPEALGDVSPEGALAHPNWRMGKRISVDSATMMNKGFEVIEAKWLFGVPSGRIDVVIHPQSTVHSMVEFVDGSVLAQLGLTDMTLPIRYALTHPERVPFTASALDWSELRRLDFAPVPYRRFPCLELARAALGKGGCFPCALNAADEVAVSAFLERRLRFLAIPAVVERVLERTTDVACASVEDVLAADAEARRLAHEEVARAASPHQY
jgi:1-deoxy-D-xylulose-5-phosphate reductoisomerase